MFLLFVVGLSTAQTIAKNAPLLASDDAEVRAKAASAIADIKESPDEPDVLPALKAALTRPRSTAPESYRILILEIWGQVPNPKAALPMWISKPEPPWIAPPMLPGQPRPRRPPPHDPDAVDWLVALNHLDLSLPDLAQVAPDPQGRKQVRAEAMEVVAIMRALPATKRAEAVEVLFNWAFELEGVFRDECGRQIRALENYAVPTLIRLQHQKGPKAKQRRYASYQLDRMDRARPQKAISAAPDDRVRAEIIHAYGESHALDAVQAILDQVDSSSHRVRRNARWAWMGYVSGPAPPPAPKRKRKLPGGKEEAAEKPDYLTYREIAELALHRQVQSLVASGAMQAPSGVSSAKDLSNFLFAQYDQKHTAEWDDVFSQARIKEQAGDLEGATDGYGWILAHDPNYGRRGEMVSAHLRMAEQLQQRGDLSRALGYYRKVIDLDPQGAQARPAAARVAYLDSAEAHGRDPRALRRAIELDPTMREAQDALTALETSIRTRRLIECASAIVVALLSLAGAILLVRRTRRPAV